MPRLTSPLRSLPVLRAGLLALAAALGACQAGPPQGREEPSDLGPAPDVNLPPVPQLETDRPMSYPDGSLSIWALSLGFEQYRNTNVQVTAWVKEIYICPFRAQMEASDRLVEYNLYLTEAERDELLTVAAGTGEPLATTPDAAGTGEGTEQPRCNYPHLFIADSMTSERQILVTGYGLPMEAQLMVGQRYLFEGRFMEETRGFNAAGQGLIYVTRISGGNLVEPPADGEQLEIQ